MTGAGMGAVARATILMRTARKTDSQRTAFQVLTRPRSRPYFDRQDLPQANPARAALGDLDEKWGKK